MKVISLEEYRKKKEEIKQAIHEVDVFLEVVKEYLRQYDPPPKPPTMPNTQTVKIIEGGNCHEIYSA